MDELLLVDDLGNLLEDTAESIESYDVKIHN